MKMKFFAIGLALILPLMAISQTTQQKPTTTATPQKPTTTATPQKPTTTTTTPQKPATQPAKPASATTTPPRIDGERAADATRRADADEAAARRAAADGDETQMYGKEWRRLEDPERGGGRPYRELLNEEDHIVERKFSDVELEPRFLSMLLWEVSATRKDEGKLREARGVDVYVLTREGVFLYNRNAHTLQTIVMGKDVRKSILTPESIFAERAPLILVYVANAKKQAKIPVGKKDFYAAMDCGIASQAAYLFCASENLVTMTIDIDPVAVGKILELKGGDKALLAQPVGFR
jgi:hypothetical protein